MNIHFIAVGGSVMHQLAIELQSQGHQVSGSDDKIFDPAKQNLSDAGLLPSQEGWFPEKISTNLDLVILGMHAKADNPELLKAKELGIELHSFPSFIAKHARNKQRIVVAGSHGKTTVTSLIINALQAEGRKFDYLIGGKPDGFEKNVRLSDDAPIMVIEGDEYLTSSLDDTPKFLHYDGHINIVTGIAWDHINVFPTLEGYTEQFKKFVEASPKSGTLIYNSSDKVLSKLVKKGAIRDDVNLVAYDAHKHKIIDGITHLIDSKKNRQAIKLFGEHNMFNINAAKEACNKVGVPEESFIKSLANFTGAAMRLQAIGNVNGNRVFRDFAHAPSKVEATTSAVKAQFGKMPLTACLELHTFSSLNKAFIPQYKNTLKKADVAVVYINPQAVAHKNLSEITNAEIQSAFNHKNLTYFTDATQMQEFIKASAQKGNVLLMSSGAFGGATFEF